MKPNYCYGCMRPLQPGQVTCPYCGWDHSYRHNDDPFLPEGTILYGKYLIGKVLGKGGFGITYLAMELTLRVRVAIKEYFPNSICTRQPDSKKVKVTSGKEAWDWYTKGLDAFQNEARTLALFNSPSIVHVREYFLANNTAYIVMDYVDGIGFGEALNLCEDRRMPWKRVVNLMMPLIGELGQLHEKNLIHRDIKPENIRIVLDTESGQEHLVLLDFGAVRGFSKGTQLYTQILTPGYAPYEQYMEQGHQGPYTDVYALCGTMYRAITGKKPTSAPDRVLTGDGKLPSFKRYGLNVPKRVEKAIMHGLERDAKDRPQSMDELYRELERIPKQKQDVKPQSHPLPLPGQEEPLPDEENLGGGRSMERSASVPAKAKRSPALIVFLLLTVLAVALLIRFVMKPPEVVQLSEQTELGVAAYERGDYGKALEYLEPAARSGDAGAMVQMGLMFLEGKGVPKSDEKAAEYFQKAADQRNEVAQQFLKMMQSEERPAAQPDEETADDFPEPDEAAKADPGSTELTSAVPANPSSTPTSVIYPTIIPTSTRGVPQTAAGMASGRFQSQKPADGTSITPGKAFDLTWTVENTGTITWTPSYKLVYDSGDNFTANKIKEQNTGVSIWEKGSADLTLHCIAPAEVGTYSMQWHVEDENGSTILSPLTIRINVAEIKMTPTSAAVFASIEDLNDWDFDIVVNYGKDDTETDLDMVSRNQTWYSHLLISGGNPGQRIKLTYRSEWPDGYIFTKSFDGSFTSGDTPYESQRYNGETGDVIVGFYDSTGTEILAEKTVWIE